MKVAVLAFLIEVTAGVARGQTISQEDISILEADCVTLMSRFHAPTKMEILVPAKSLTKAMLALHPVRVTVAEEGLYIATQTLPGREAGLYCPSRTFPDGYAESLGWQPVWQNVYKNARHIPL